MNSESINAHRGVLIIGNGFDRSLGLKTSYAEFFEAEKYFPIDDSRLCKYIVSEMTKPKDKREKNWSDLEFYLATYANIDFMPSRFKIREGYGKTPNLSKNERSKARIDADRLYYQKLNDGLRAYIDSVTSGKEITSGYIARDMLHMILEYGQRNFDIYSYNYTDPYRITKCHPIIPVHYLHGSIENHSVILGISDNEEVYPGYEFMIKIMNSHYKSNDIRFSLQEAELVIFFGHSLGASDYHYFEDFFTDSCKSDSTREFRKKVFFITKDEDSRYDILLQLRKMNNKRTNYFFSNNDVRFIYTSEEHNADTESTLNLSSLIVVLKNMSEQYVLS